MVAFASTEKARINTDDSNGGICFYGEWGQRQGSIQMTSWKNPEHGMEGTEINIDTWNGSEKQDEHVEEKSW